MTQMYKVAVLAATVVSMCILCWLPYLGSAEDALRVLRRITPVQRGLFEDYVANFWCTSHPLVHWKKLFSQTTLVRLCMGATSSRSESQLCAGSSWPPSPCECDHRAIACRNDLRCVFAQHAAADSKS
jgi:hypothetical protein